jgi:regulation of enolase protein 1 (concanavalin A-like superfamily)
MVEDHWTNDLTWRARRRRQRGVLDSGRAWRHALRSSDASPRSTDSLISGVDRPGRRLDAQNMKVDQWGFPTCALPTIPQGLTLESTNRDRDLWRTPTVTCHAADTAPTTTTAPLSIAQVSDRAWAWNREPVDWDGEGTSVVWCCPGGSDFWRRTEGVPSAHDGCSLLTPVDGDFEIELAAAGAFEELYDQVGLMVAASEVRWLKVGIELDGELWLSAVHTREESDWSRERWHAPEVRLRAVRRDGTVEVFVDEAGTWRVCRTVYLPGRVGIGPYSCAPKGHGFQASVSYLRVRG